MKRMGGELSTRQGDDTFDLCLTFPNQNPSIQSPSF